MEPFTGSQRAFCVRAYYTNNNSATIARLMYRAHFGLRDGSKAPSAKSIYKWVKMFEKTGSTLRIINESRPKSARTPENIQRVHSESVRQNPHVPATNGEGASVTGLTVTRPLFSLLDANQGGFTKTETLIASEGEQPESSATLVDAVVTVKQEIEDAEEEGEDYLLVDQVEVADDEDESGEQTDDQESETLTDAAINAKSEEETDISEDDSSISDTSEEQQQAGRMQRKQEEEHSNKETSHECSVCGEVFDKIQACLRHMWQNHTREKPFTCHLCWKAFKNKRTLRQHKIIHSNERLYPCDLCQKTFKRRGDRHRHVAACHSDERPYACDLCNKTFKLKLYLQQHKAACHSDEKPYSCDLCGKTFKRKTYVLQHKVACQSKERPFSCKFCEKTFKQKADVQQHKVECHSGERPFSCDLCEKSFKRKTHVQLHKAVCH